MYSAQVVDFGQSGSSRKRGSIRANWLFLGKVVVLGQSGCIRAKVVFIGQKWLYSGKEVVIGQKLLRSNSDCDVTESYLQ